MIETLKNVLEKTEFSYSINSLNGAYDLRIKYLNHSEDMIASVKIGDNIYYYPNPVGIIKVNDQEEKIYLTSEVDPEIRKNIEGIVCDGREE